MNIGLLGFGVVGGGVWELAQENRALNVKKVLVRREAPSLGKAAVQDVEAILRDTDIDTVVEVLGGLHPAYEWICRALAAGKDVVTANKAVISAYYRELTALWTAKLKSGGLLAYEIGLGQEKDVRSILEEHGYISICETRDLCGIIRTVSGIKP